VIVKISQGDLAFVVVYRIEQAEGLCDPVAVHAAQSSALACTHACGVGGLGRILYRALESLYDLAVRL